MMAKAIWRGAWIIGMAIALLPAEEVGAQQTKPKTIEEYQAISDRALAQAMERAAQEQARQATAPVTAPMLQTDQLRKAPGVDPMEIANRYRNFSVTLPPAEDLLIFVSSSLSMETLKRLGYQAKAAGAILVFRGIAGDLRKRGELAKWVKYLEPVIRTGANIQINPKVFTQYNISAVPAFALAVRSEECATEQCKVASAVVAGDVSLDYALEHWIQGGGQIGQKAQGRLDRMQVSSR